MDRPRVSVIVPFHGDEAAARAAVEALRRIELRPGDELLVADNTPAGVFAALAPEGFHAAARSQPYSARNEAVARATGEWLLFTDADCRPQPGILDAYFAGAPRERDGALAGEIVAGDGTTLAARYAADRRLLSSSLFLAHPYRPMAVTANLLVRRAAFEEVGGFHEGIRSGGDADLCWRLQDAGWSLGHRPAAVVVHEHRATIRELVRQAARTAAGSRWLEARHPGLRPNAGGWRRAARALAGAVAWPLRGRPERGAFKAIELLVIAAEHAGRLSGNAREAPLDPVDRALAADEWPVPGACGAPLVLARRRPPGAVARHSTVPVLYAEDVRFNATRRLAGRARAAGVRTIEGDGDWARDLRRALAP